MFVRLDYLQNTTTMTMNSMPTTIELKKDTEWRFEVDSGSSVGIKLISGTAEIFGVELVIGLTYNFSGRKLAIFSWIGCTFEVTGETSSEYVADETPMTVYANLHFSLEKTRKLTSSSTPKISAVPDIHLFPHILQISAL